MRAPCSRQGTVGSVPSCCERKRFGQWAKQLTVIRDNRLQVVRKSESGKRNTRVHFSHDIPTKTELDKRLSGEKTRAHSLRQRGELPALLLAPSTTQWVCGVPRLGPNTPFALRILKACSSEELGRWLGVLLAETGGPKSSSITSTYFPRTYEEPGPERRSSFSASDSGRTKPGLALKRVGSNTNQYGLYGKTRAEEDAKLYLREKEQLERERDGIRNTLLTLRQERREVKERLKTATEEQRGSLSERVSQLEEACRGKESERVDLELRLTQAKDNLKKSLAGGALGAPGESKTLQQESVRLVDGAGLCSGRVEVKSNQSWASECEADFDWQNAEVVCREIGCGSPSALRGRGSMEKGSPGATRGQRCSGATISPSPAPLSASTQEAPSSSRSLAPTEHRPSQLSITLLPSSSLLQMTPTKGTTAVFMRIMFSLITSSECEHLSLTVTASPLTAFPIRLVVVLLMLVTTTTATYLYFNTTRRKKREEGESVEMVSLQGRTGPRVEEERVGGSMIDDDE
ncbi:hypothetical protein J4Q44_G00311330 [Coregonus suidteri]|uniref:SRCR domain-containing protein n=1 Tax=Coregonus suidteri TaxID=861788 RepID=A0AAN8KUH8_9TELE